MQFFLWLCSVFGLHSSKWVLSFVSKTSAESVWYVLLTVICVYGRRSAGNKVVRVITHLRVCMYSRSRRIRCRHCCTVMRLGYPAGTYEHVNIFSPEQNDIVQICANKSFNCIKKKIKSTHIWRCAVTNFVCEKGLVCLNNTAVTKASVAQIHCEWCIKPTSTPNDERLHTKTHTCTQLNKHYTTGTLMMFSHVPLMFLASWSKLLFSGIVVILLL